MPPHRCHSQFLVRVALVARHSRCTGCALAVVARQRLLRDDLLRGLLEDLLAAEVLLHDLLAAAPSCFRRNGSRPPGRREPKGM